MSEEAVKALIAGAFLASVVWVVGFMALTSRLHSDAIEAGVGRYNAVSGGFEYIRKEK